MVKCNFVQIEVRSQVRYNDSECYMHEQVFFVMAVRFEENVMQWMVDNTPFLIKEALRGTEGVPRVCEELFMNPRMAWECDFEMPAGLKCNMMTRCAAIAFEPPMADQADRRYDARGWLKSGRYGTRDQIQA